MMSSRLSLKGYNRAFTENSGNGICYDHCLKAYMKACLNNAH